MLKFRKITSDNKGNSYANLLTRFIFAWKLEVGLASVVHINT